MEFPFGHHHHHRRDDDEDERGRFPPPFPPAVDDPEAISPPPGVYHASHQTGSEYAPPPPFFGAPPQPFFEAHPPPRPSPYAEDSFQDARYETPYGREEGHHRPGPPHPSPYAEDSFQDARYETPYGREEGHRRPGHSDDVSHEGVGGSLKRQQTVRVFTKAEENYSLSIRDGKVILARQDPGDEYQHWIKDMRYSTKIKDEESFPAFALVNKATGEAIKHSFGATHPVQLVPYNPNFLDESVLWTESRDVGDGFRCIRMVNNIGLNFDAFNGDEDHGGVHDGTVIVLWEWLKGKNQRWKIVPY